MQISAVLKVVLESRWQIRLVVMEQRSSEEHSSHIKDSKRRRTSLGEFSSKHTRIAKHQDNCDGKVRRFSLPNLGSGSTVFSCSECAEEHSSNFTSQKLVVPVKTYEKLTKPNLGSGGAVIYEELAKYITIPNMDTDAIVVDDILHDFQPPKTLPVDDLMQTNRKVPVLARSHSGGGLTEEYSEISISGFFPVNGF